MAAFPEKWHGCTDVYWRFPCGLADKRGSVVLSGWADEWLLKVIVILNMD